MSQPITPAIIQTVLADQEVMTALLEVGKGQYKYVQKVKADPVSAEAERKALFENTVGVILSKAVELAGLPVGQATYVPEGSASLFEACIRIEDAVVFQHASAIAEGAARAEHEGQALSADVHIDMTIEDN